MWSIRMKGFLPWMFAVLALGCSVGTVGCASDTDAPPVDADAGLPDEREPCADRDPLRRPFFGDLHVHTRLSFDAAAWGTRSTPEDAYRYARGEPLGLFPYDAAGEGTRTIQLARPLDFAAVTDHAEFLAEVSMCTDPSSPAYDTSTCEGYRDADSEGFTFGEFPGTFLTDPPRRPRICEPFTQECADTLARVWWDIQEAAEAYYDRSSACEFTTFVAYEWSATTGATANIHRNVIFRNRAVPAVPTSYVDAPTPEEMWSALDATCNDTDTPCEALAIPHNSNVGGGLMFEPADGAGTPYTREDAERRSRLEPLMEIYQHKGAAECLPGVVPHPLASEDPFCDFEQLHPTFCTGEDTDPPRCIPLCTRLGGGGLTGGCVSPNDFARPALLRGLSEWRRVGANPFDFGFIGSTDTHSGASGHVWEEGWEGHLADRDDTVAERVREFDVAFPGIKTNSPGGLAVLWAEDNSRDALFDAMARREAYATSGTRMEVRFFGGEDLPEGLCDDEDLVAVGYERGVPMGGELEARAEAPPRFVVWALRDPESVPLERIQIVKGTLVDGELHEEVVDVIDAIDDVNGPAAVDLATCAPEPNGSGASQLCGTWVDAGHDPGEPAFYYARVLENPTCRWSHHQCLEAAVDCDALEAGDPLWACCDGSIPATIRERAWTSPIWVLPAP
jgi:hypothetical protein